MPSKQRAGRPTKSSTWPCLRWSFHKLHARSSSGHESPRSRHAVSIFAVYVSFCSPLVHRKSKDVWKFVIRWMAEKGCKTDNGFRDAGGPNEHGVHGVTSRTRTTRRAYTCTLYVQMSHGADLYISHLTQMASESVVANYQGYSSIAYVGRTAVAPQTQLRPSLLVSSGQSIRLDMMQTVQSAPTDQQSLPTFCIRNLRELPE
ncbi:hypothetical protein EJ03DRAFT_1387 [Teratosphaeria nubilosa]|uniref:Uncharacterized protein n=1 Tax=Teratosphaeria nubilosa TaxID=161662 RepID=A0A6G1LNE8_9PEZI|nr:hypothetical protein EJ03DRAFT_1387 [Teratosphaeria nubilosa]